MWKDSHSKLRNPQSNTWSVECGVLSIRHKFGAISGRTCPFVKLFTDEALFSGHPDERPPSLVRSIDNVNLNINVVISTPDERPPLLKGHFSDAKGVASLEGFHCIHLWSCLLLRVFLSLFFLSCYCIYISNVSGSVQNGIVINVPPIISSKAATVNTHTLLSIYVDSEEFWLWMYVTRGTGGHVFIHI